MVAAHDLPEHLKDGSRIGFVHSAETTSAVNGPGLRYTVFVSGCPLRCLYCHNPDTQMARLGDRTTVQRVLRDAERYRAFLTRGGGLTISGGEPLLQPRFIEDVFTGAKHDLGLHTALDTSAANQHRATDRLLDSVDLVLLDIKAAEPELYRRVTTDGDIEDLLRFADRLAEHGSRVWIRFVLVPGLTDDPGHVARVADLCVRWRAMIDRVEVLPYHTLGVGKYAAVGRSYPLLGTPTPTHEQVEAALAIFRERDLEALA